MLSAVSTRGWIAVNPEKNGDLGKIPSIAITFILFTTDLGNFWSVRNL
jgi:hypothetical protein